MVRFMDWVKLDKKYKKLFFILLILFTLYVLPIIQADRYYQDDLARSLYGTTGWVGDGRPLTELLLRFLCGTEQGVVDISPMPLLLSVLLLAYTLTLYAREKMSDFKMDIVQVYALFLVIANPFLLTNLSYKFDCVSMILALCLMFVMHLISDFVSARALFCIAFMLDILALSLYQPVVGAGIGLSLLNVLFLLLAAKKNFGRELIKLGALGIGCIFYKLVIASNFVDKTGWRYEASKLVSNIQQEDVQTIFANLKSLVKRMIPSISVTPKYIMVILGLVCISSLIILLRTFWKQNNSTLYKVAGSIYMVALPILTGVSGIVPLVVIKNLPINDRLFISFSIFLLYMGFLFLFLGQKWKRLTVLAVCICITFHFSYAYTYGNALECQKEYETYMVYNIQHDIESINSEGDFTRVSISGKTPRAPELQMLCNRYPQFYNMVPVYIDNSTWLGGVWLYRYMQERLTLVNMEEADYDVMNQAAPVKQNSLYSCFTNNDKIIIHFN